jgi:hypothetical protein
MLTCPKCGGDCSVVQCGDPYSLSMTNRVDDRELAVMKCDYVATCPKCGRFPFFIQHEQEP